MRERPSLMSGPLVRAVLEGRKTQTRRPVKLRGAEVIAERDDDGLWPWSPQHDGWIACPFGQVGDRLWVRESYAPNYFGKYEHGYRADWTGADGVPEPRWTPSIHMLKEHCRLRLRITDVRVERLQSISEEDARAEGCEPGIVIWQERGLSMADEHRTARDAFRAAWSGIYGADAWDRNDWAWCISFEREVTP